MPQRLPPIFYLAALLTEDQWNLYFFKERSVHWASQCIQASLWYLGSSVIFILEWPAFWAFWPLPQHFAKAVQASLPYLLFVIVFPTLEGDVSSIAILTRRLNSQSWESTPVVINSSLSGLMCHPSPQSSILKIPSQICSLGSSWHVLARFCDSFSKQSLFSHSRPGCDVILLMISETGRGGGNTSRWRSVSP